VTGRCRVLAAMLACAVAAVPATAADTGPSAHAEETPRDIAVADPQRRAMLDALHTAVDRDLGQPNRFVVRTLRVQGRWGYAVVDPRTPAGGRIDLARTSHAEAAREGLLDGDAIHALLERGKTGWIVKAWVMAPTDIAWADWPDDYGVPYRLLGLPPPD